MTLLIYDNNWLLTFWNEKIRLDSESNSSVDSEPPSLLTPAMQDVIRVREVRKSMEQSCHYFTPVCSPMDQSSSASAKFPSSTPYDQNADQELYGHHLTLDCSSEREEEEEPIRKKTLRDRKTLLIDSTTSSIDSSTAGEMSLTPEAVQHRVIHKSHYIYSNFICFNFLFS